MVAVRPAVAAALTCEAVNAYPVLASFTALPNTTPATAPDVSSKGPPELPGCTVARTE
jgi:hypothetical protein